MSEQLPKDFGIDEVAEALGMSTSWLRRRIRDHKVEHQRHGHKIAFTPAQVEKLRASLTVTPPPVPESITTGKGG